MVKLGFHGSLQAPLSRAFTKTEQCMVQHKATTDPSTCVGPVDFLDERGLQLVI